MRILLLLMLALAWAEEPTEGEWLVVEMTSYCPCRICTEGLGITKDGTRVHDAPYGLAGCRRTFRLGQRVWIPAGQGILDKLFKVDRLFTIDDRGSALDTEGRRRGIPRLDLRVKHHGTAVRFGRRLVIVVVRPAWPKETSHEETLRILGVGPYYQPPK